MHRIKEILEERGIKQADLARRLGTSPVNITRKLKKPGEPQYRPMDLEELFQYADAIGVPAYRLIEGSERARELTKEQEALVAAFNALDREGQLAMLAEFATQAFDPRSRQGRRSPARHGSPKH